MLIIAKRPPPEDTAESNSRFPFIKGTDIRVANQARSKLSLTTKNLKTVVLDQGVSSLEHDIVVTLEYYIETHSLRLEYTTGDIVFLGGNAAMGGSTHVEQWFKKGQ